MHYYQYFRLKGPPFQPASPDGAVYLSPTHLEGLATLESGLSGDLTGLTLLTGEAGTGKTTLIYSLLQRDFKRVRIAHIEDPKLSFPEIMRVVLTHLNLYSTGSTKLDHLEALDRFLELRGKDERIALVVDESQLLSDDVLEELRLLSNRGDRRLQLILVGHPELAERLKKPELRQLNQRISSRGVLNPLTAAQAAKYVECKLSAQGSSSAAIFDRGALKRLLRRSDGIPRKINMLCHTAMQSAYNAGERKVSYKTANKTAADYHDSVKVAKPGFDMRPLVWSAVGIALAALLLLGFVHPNIWSELKLNHTGTASEQTVRPSKRAGKLNPSNRPSPSSRPSQPSNPSRSSRRSRSSSLSRSSKLASRIVRIPARNPTPPLLQRPSGPNCGPHFLLYRPHLRRSKAMLPGRRRPRKSASPQPLLPRAPKPPRLGNRPGRSPQALSGEVKLLSRMVTHSRKLPFVISDRRTELTNSSRRTRS